jgi:hypothetical protein
MADSPNCATINADTNDDRGICRAEILIVESSALNGSEPRRGKDRPPVHRRFISNSAVPARLRKLISEYCRRLGLTRKRDRQAVAREMRLRFEYGNLYVAYLPTHNGIYVIATARPGIDDIHTKIKEAGGLTRAESCKVIINTPMPGENEQACIWSPRAAAEV